MGASSLHLTCMILLTVTLLLVAGADVESCDADLGGSDCKRKRLMSTNKFVSILEQPGELKERVQKMLKHVRKERVNVSATIDGQPILMEVIKRYNYLYQTEIGTETFVKLVLAMCEAGSDPKLDISGSPLRHAVDALNLPLMRVLLSVGVSTKFSHSGRGSVNFVLHSLTGNAFKAVVSRILRLALSANTAITNGNAKTADEVVYSYSNDWMINVYENSPALRSAFSQIDGTPAHATISYALLRVVYYDFVELLVREFHHSKDFDVIANMLAGDDGRNCFHNVAFNGLPGVALLITEIAVDGGAETARAALDALKVNDSLNRTAFDIAAVRYGEASDIFRSLVSATTTLTQASKATLNSSEFLKQFHRDLRSLSVDFHNNSSTSVASRQTVARSAYTSLQSGGWPVSSYGSTEFDTSPPGRCDVASLDAPVRQEHLLRYAAAEQPVLIRGEALGYKLREDWTRDGFVAKYGRELFRIQAVMNGDNFLLPIEKSTVAKYVKYVENISTATERSTETPLYGSFQRNFVKQNPNLKTRLEARRLCQMIGGHSRDLQFYFGPPGSGAQYHINDASFAVVAYGRKHWFIKPPGAGHHSARPVLDWLREDYSPTGQLECVQEAGDILFLPSNWAHQVINVEATIGVAHFCIY